MHQKALIVRKIRQQLRLSPRELADALGMGPRGSTLVRKWENGVAVPTASALAALRFLVRLDRLERAMALSLNAKDRESIQLVLRNMDRVDPTE
jgi:transcriptional regulator with XRE-family HTH domain